MHITFVCTGNTCRSPMAQGIFDVILKERGITSVTCSSCGLCAFGGDSVSPEAVEAAKKYSADISSHRSRPLTQYIADETDWFVCMTRSHAAALKSAFKDKKITVLGSGIADPYAQPQAVYDECAAQIKSALDILADIATMQISPFDKSFVDGVEAVEKTCFSSPWSREGIEQELSNETAHFLVAHSGDKTIGYIGVHEVAGEAYIANVAVLGEYRQNGVATELLNAAEKGAADRGCEFISLEVRKSNEPAISLYKKRGYTVRGERKSFYSNPTEDALIMTLDLF